MGSREIMWEINLMREKNEKGMKNVKRYKEERDTGILRKKLMNGQKKEK